MKKSIYLKSLSELQEIMNNSKVTSFINYAKVVTLVIMNMRYEKIAFNSKFNEHPYLLTKQIIDDAILQYKQFLDISFIEDLSIKQENSKSKIKEEKHEDLFNEIWNRYDAVQFQEYIERYNTRIKINNIQNLIKDKQCVDLGCGNGVFCFALLENGAKEAIGVDFGKNSIEYASFVSKQRGLEKCTLFKNATVYDTGFDDNSFDFAIQNGVFHHLDDEDKAIQETRRILKKGGWFWYYTDGEGGISYDLWDTSVNILQDVSALFIENILINMNISRNKMVHLMDGLSATYAHTSWDKITKRLSEYGFGNFKRLTGGFNTDFDLDRIESDPYGKEKFGEGDLRLLCQLVEK